MFGYVIMGFFAAFGVLCALWAVFGVIFSGRLPCELTLRCPADKELTCIRRLCWFKEMGLLELRLTVLDSGLNARQQQMITEKYPYIEFKYQ